MLQNCCVEQRTDVSIRFYLYWRHSAVGCANKWLLLTRNDLYHILHTFTWSYSPIVSAWYDCRCRCIMRGILYHTNSLLSLSPNALSCYGYFTGVQTEPKYWHVWQFFASALCSWQYIHCMESACDVYKYNVLHLPPMNIHVLYIWWLWQVPG